MKLTEVARVIRSKNAGPTTLTLDLLFNDAEDYARACAAPALRADAIAALYRVPVRCVHVMPYPPALALKISLDRRVIAGDPGDRDVYGAQQHVLLLGLEL